MVPESQFDRWRHDLTTNLKKAGEALADDDDKRFQLAVLAIDMTNRVMLAERLGMLSLALNRNDEVLAQVLDRVGSGEKIAERLIKSLESVESDLPEDAQLNLNFLETWLAPESGISFTPPDKS
jgi:hypothetical protein